MRIAYQNQVGTVEKVNLEIEKQKSYQKTLDPTSTKDREEKNSEIQRLIYIQNNIKKLMILHTLKKYWWIKTEEGNGPKIEKEMTTITEK